MVYVTFFPSFSLLNFDRLKKLFLILKPKQKPLLWHKMPLYKKWFLRRKQDLMLKEGVGGDSNRVYSNNPQEKKVKKVKAPRQTPIHYSDCFPPL